MQTPRFRLAFLAWGLFFSLGLAAAQSPAAIQLTVDATRSPRMILHTHMVLPVQPGPLTLYYPKWIPGEHQPDGPIANLTGLEFHANGRRLNWRRDLLDVFTFHLRVPAGARRLSVDFDYIEPSAGNHYSAGASATAKLLDLSWNQNLLYPAGALAQQLSYQATLLLPRGWKFGTALPVASHGGNRVVFRPAALNRLVDSPVIAGQYYRAINLTPPGELIHHEIDIVADSRAALAMNDKTRQGLIQLVRQTGLLFGARHYRDYHFLFTLSNHVAHFGLEHHECDDSRLSEDVLLSPAAPRLVGSLLAHEFVHSWNGKFRRPKDLSPPYYEAPQKTDLLWVYEGLTDYLGNILATRSGLFSLQDYHRYLAGVIASLGPGRPGRTWRPLLDTAAAVPGMFPYAGWMNWKRGTDYYQEGDLVWLQVTDLIHRLSQGRKSFDDFCRLFYGGPNRGPQLQPYTFQQLVAALNQIVPYDWAGFFHRRLMSVSPVPPLGGVQGSGWRLAFNAHPTAPSRFFGGGINAEYSVGLMLAPNGDVLDSVWNAPAFQAGVTSGMRIAGVNGRVFSPAVFNQALAATAGPHPVPMRLLVVNDDYFKTAALDYRGGPRYPHLERIPGAPDYLDQFLAPLQ